MDIYVIFKWVCILFSHVKEGSPTLSYAHISNSMKSARRRTHTAGFRYIDSTRRPLSYVQITHYIRRYIMNFDWFILFGLFLEGSLPLWYCSHHRQHVVGPKSYAYSRVPSNGVHSPVPVVRSYRVYYSRRDILCIVCGVVCISVSSSSVSITVAALCEDVPKLAIRVTN